MTDISALPLLKGKKALVTGIANDQSIAWGCAKAFHALGADVAITYERSAERAADVVRAIEAKGRRAVAIQADSADASAVKRSVDEAAESLGGLDILVNNAGIARGGMVAEMSLADIDAILDVNVRSVVLASQAAIPHLEPGSSIVTTGSVQGTQPSPDKIDYALTKGAIGVFTSGLAQQLAPKGIRVNQVSPGPVWTPLQPGSDDAETVSEFGGQAPFGRPGQPAELAAAYVHLVSPESSYTSGATITIAGAMPAV